MTVVTGKETKNKYYENETYETVLPAEALNPVLVVLKREIGEIQEGLKSFLSGFDFTLLVIKLIFYSLFMEPGRRYETPGSETAHSAGSMNIMMVVLLSLPNSCRGCTDRPRWMLHVQWVASRQRTT